MVTVQKTVRNLYRDSLTLMQLSVKLGQVPGVNDASVMMATESNLSLMREAGLLENIPDLSPSDLFIVLQGQDEELLTSALAEAESALLHASAAETDRPDSRRILPRTIEMGLAELPAANLALIATPGNYAAAEALKALHFGLNVMLFSDNVDLADEVRLKQLARDHDLLVMGPDCGTAIINGVPLGFANVVCPGNIGLVAASGTGLQQVTCLIDRWGEGVSQAIGTGGHDLHASVGGITMMQSLAMLAADPKTDVIVLISKPPAADVATQVLAKAEQAGKPVVVNFLGADPTTIQGDGIYAAHTLEEAASLAVSLARGKQPGEQQPFEALPEPLNVLQAEIERLQPQQQYIRGLYSGGTFCYEAVLLLADTLGPVNSNLALEAHHLLPDVWRSRQHTVVDLGDDLFTRGRPHPMIDQRLRNERILQEAADPEVAVILLDIVLGYGSHPDPAAEMVPIIRQARETATQSARHLIIIASVCGTAADPQSLERQESTLREAGVLLAASNAQAVRLAAAAVSQIKV